MAATPKTKLFVGHLPDGCTNDDLQLLFEKYGKVQECDVINKYGFVHMSTPEEADMAIKGLNNFSFRGSSISVEQSKSRLHPQPGAPGRAKTNLRRSGGGGGGGGMGERNGFGSRMDPYAMDMMDGYRSSMAYPSDMYYERAYARERMERMRPYPSPYERASAGMMSLREEYARRSLPPLAADPYALPLRSAAGGAGDDMYERRSASMMDRSDYLYSRRSPTSALPRSSYWYDSYGDSSRTMSSLSAARRPAYY